jgi:L-fucose dehydrogenase
MNLQLREKVILVTNAADGIGESIVHRLALEEAYPVVIGSNEEDNLKIIETLQAAGGYGIQIVADTATEAERAVNQVIAHFGRIDGLVNNADISHGESRNQDALMTQYCFPWLKETKGSIVTIGQNDNDFLQNWATELANNGIRANTVELQQNFCPPDELANLVVFLISKRLTHTTGQRFRVGK